MRVYVNGIGVLGPGLTGWLAARLILRGEAPYARTEMPQASGDFLPPVERRRCGDTVKLAVHVGVEALTGAGADAERLATVFTSSSGNGEVLHQICATLAGAERDVSPTRFHNSVHNAPAGYWSIATKSREPSTSLCALDGSFAAGLLEASLQSTAELRAVLFVAYDKPHPEPLAAACPVVAPFGVALLLADKPSAASRASLDVALARSGSETRLADPTIEALRQGNSAARSLPLLAALAAERDGRVTLDYLPEQRLEVVVTPCV